MSSDPEDPQDPSAPPGGSDDGNGNGHSTGRGAGKPEGLPSQEASEPVDPERANPSLIRASDALSREDWEAAEEAFAEAIALSPLDSRGHLGLALVAIHLQDWDRAIAHGRQGASLPGAPAELHNNLGWSLEQVDKIDQAKDAYAKAFEVDPTRSEPILHLLRHGIIPQLPDEEAGAPLELEVLQRLELYQHLAGPVQRDGCDHTWRGTWVWAMERGAPWGQIVAWLVQQGVRCDCTVLTHLSRRDEHLAETVVRGFVIAPEATIEAAVAGQSDLILARSDAELEEAPRIHTKDGQSSVLTLLIEVGVGRAQVPAQRTHAGVVYYTLVQYLPLFGPDASVALVLDPAAHIGPRRVWLFSPIAEAELVGTWRGTWSDGQPVGANSLPGDVHLPVDSVPLAVPGVDAASLDSAVEDAGLSHVVRSQEEGGGLFVDADGVGKEPDAWRSLLVRLSRWIPEGALSSVVWREGPTVYLAHLRRSAPPRIATLEAVFPEAAMNTDLPLDAGLVMLARALFDAPQSARYLGA